MPSLAAGAALVNEALAEKPQQIRDDLQALRLFFNPADYGNSFVSRVHNTIGFHYDHGELAALVEQHINQDAIAEATAAEVGGLGRMADSVLLAVMDEVASGDLFTGGETSRQRIGQALDIAGKLITAVDELVDGLMQHHPDALLRYQLGAVEIPPLVREAKELVDRMRAEGDL
jgi:hypothetical protein